MFTFAFWRAAAERAAKTSAQCMLLVVTAGMINAGGQPVVDAWLLDYKTIVGVALGGAFLSVLTSIATAAATDGSPSAGPEVLARRAAEE